MPDEQTRRDAFDRIAGTLHDLPDVERSRASTIVTALPLTGEVQTYVVQTYHQKKVGFTVFVQSVSAAGSTRMVLPDKVAEAIYRQREALIKTGRKKRGKERWEQMTEEQREATVTRLRTKEEAS